MSIYSVVITDAGAQVLARAVGGEVLTFTRARLGTGIFTGDLRTRTKLVEPVAWSGLGEAVISGNVINVPANYSNRNGATYIPTFVMNEIGLYGGVTGGQETLIAYANAGEDGDGITIPGDTLTEFIYNFILAVSGAAEIRINSSSIAYLTRDELDSALAGKADAEHLHDAGDISSGVLPVARGGTGRGSITGGYVPVGNGTAPVLLRKIATGAPVMGSNEIMTSGYAYAGMAGKADLTVVREVTLAAAGWSAEGAQSVTVLGVTDDNVVTVSIDPAATREQRDAARYAQIHATGQGVNGLSFVCDGEIPEIDIPIFAAIIGDEGTDAATEIADVVSDLETAMEAHTITYDAEARAIVITEA